MARWRYSATAPAAGRARTIPVSSLDRRGPWIRAPPPGFSSSTTTRSSRPSGKSVRAATRHNQKAAALGALAETMHVRFIERGVHDGGADIVATIRRGTAPNDLKGGSMQAYPGLDRETGEQTLCKFGMAAVPTVMISRNNQGFSKKVLSPTSSTCICYGT